MVYLTYTSIGRQDLHLLRRVNAKHLRSPVFKCSGYRPPFSLGYPAMELPRNYHKLLGAAFHLRSALGATQSSNLALGVGFKPTYR